MPDNREFVAAISKGLLQMTFKFPPKKAWTQFFWYYIHFPLLKEYINKGKCPLASQYYSVQIVQKKNLLP